MNGTDQTGLHCPILTAASLAGVLINLMVGWLDGVSSFFICDSLIGWFVVHGTEMLKGLKPFNYKLHDISEETKLRSSNAASSITTVTDIKWPLTFSLGWFVFADATAPSWPRPHHCRGVTITYNDASQSVGLLWTSDQLVAETSTWQHTTLTTDIHALRGIRTHNLSRRTAADLCLRLRGHWDRQSWVTSPNKRM